MKLKNNFSLKFCATIGLLSIFSIAHADCYDDAATYHNVNAMVLKAIAAVETGFKPATTSKNTNGSVDIGLTGTNSIHLPELNKFGVRKEDLYDSCKSIYVSAWLLRKKINKHGNTWTAVGAYHSETPYYREIYASKIRVVVNGWNQQLAANNRF